MFNDGKEPPCVHNFNFLRQENRDKNPGQWHSDRIIVDIYFCSFCLVYKEVIVKEVHV